MTKREKIIELARELGLALAEGIGGMDEFLVAFYHKAQREALANIKVSIPTETMEQAFQQYHTLGYAKGRKEAIEQAAKVCEKTVAAIEGQLCADAIRQLTKES